MAIQSVIPSPAAAGQLSAPPARQQSDAPVPTEKKNLAQDTVRLSTGVENTVVQAPAARRVEQTPAATETQRSASATAPSAPASPAGGGGDAERTIQPRTVSDGSPAAAPARTPSSPVPAEGTATDNRVRQENRAVNQVLASQAERSYAASLQGRINRNGFNETA
ncbi:MAG: hypothetical protein AB1568_00830 [Thermodesulfobacteriota bacterium]